MTFKTFLKRCRWSVLLIGGALLSGCATNVLKSTPFYESGNGASAGETSDRVNLWPVAYWRNPVGSVARPLISFSDDYLALRPIYSQCRQGGRGSSWDEFNLAWPLA